MSRGPSTKALYRTDADSLALFDRHRRVMRALERGDLEALEPWEALFLVVTGSIGDNKELLAISCDAVREREKAAA